MDPSVAPVPGPIRERAGTLEGDEQKEEGESPVTRREIGPERPQAALEASNKGQGRHRGHAGVFFDGGQQDGALDEFRSVAGSRRVEVEEAVLGSKGNDSLPPLGGGGGRGEGGRRSYPAMGWSTVRGLLSGDSVTQQRLYRPFCARSWGWGEGGGCRVFLSQKTKPVASPVS